MDYISIQKLDAIGFQWDPGRTNDVANKVAKAKRQSDWFEWLQELKEHKSRYVTANITP